MHFLILTLIVCLLLTLLILRRRFWIVSVDGESMMPALDDGDRVLVVRHLPGSLVRRGQIAIVTPAHVPGDVRFVKRIIALPGDTLITRLTELHPAIRPDHETQYDAEGCRHWQIPPGHVFVRGDAAGSDSRAWGPVAYKALQGIVLCRLKPTSTTAVSPPAPTTEVPPGAENVLENTR